MTISTLLTKRLGIKHPIIQGGMHYVGYAPLVAAVSNAGALGVVTALTQPDAPALRDEIRKARYHSQESGDYTVMPRPEAARARVLVPTHDLTLVLASRHAKDFGFRARCRVADFFRCTPYRQRASRGRGPSRRTGCTSRPLARSRSK